MARDSLRVALAGVALAAARRDQQLSDKRLAAATSP